MKKFLVTLLAVAAVFGLCACGSLFNKGANFSKEDLVLTDGSDTFEVELNHSVYVWPDYTYVEAHSDYSYEELETVYETAKGLAIGDSVRDYKEMYFKSNSYAVWELCDSQNYTQFSKYTGQSAADMVDVDNATWLDVGFYLDKGKWKQLTDVEVKDIWLCEADLDDFDEVVIMSVNLDEFDEINCISINYFEYDEDFVVYQDWLDE